MSTIEIVLLLIGAAILTVSFFLPTRRKTAFGDAGKLAKEEVKELVSQETDTIREQVNGMIKESMDTSMEYAIEKTERALERLSNEKIMAVNEYSDTVLGEINRNHKEVVFLYDMLNDKHKSIKATMSEITGILRAAAEKRREEGNCPDMKSGDVRLGDQSGDRRPDTKSGGFRQDPGPSEIRPDVRNGDVRQETGFGDVRQEAARPLRIQETPGRSGLQGLESRLLQDGASAQAAQDFNCNRQILELYSQGKSKVDIAKELGLGVGEVKLVIDLYQGT